jgi:hypothetical protein
MIDDRLRGGWAPGREDRVGAGHRRLDCRRVQHVGHHHLQPLVVDGEPGGVADYAGDGVAGVQGLLDEPAPGLAAGAEDGEPHHVLHVGITDTHSHARTLPGRWGAGGSLRVLLMN